MLIDLSANQFETEIAKQESALLLDVRTEEEYYYGHLKGSLLIPVSELSERITEIESYRDKQILVYCRSGVRSITAGEILAENGFDSVAHLEPGISGWLMAEKSVVI